MKDPTVEWYKNALVYGLDVDLYQDCNGDGIGDFPGLTDRLDYLSWLGVDALWLLPFYPTPGQDNGYDVADYFGVERTLGSLADFEAFVGEAQRRGIRVILDLVVNHTSDQHPWFQAARTGRSSPYHDYYAWTDSPSKEPSSKVIFPEAEQSVWEYDERASAYYLHHFYKFEPDLNTANPAVRREIMRIVDFWMNFGVSGFRVDAAPYFKDGERKLQGAPHGLLREIATRAKSHRADAVIFVEADEGISRLGQYFEEVDMLLNFQLDSHLFLAMATESADPVHSITERLPKPPDGGQWLNFLRNLDELDLEQLNDQERQRVYATFAPDKDMRAYSCGIRRRLAPMLSGDPRRPGSPTAS